MSEIYTTLRRGSLEIESGRVSSSILGREGLIWVPESVILGFGTHAISLELRKNRERQLILKRYLQHPLGYLGINGPADRAALHERERQAEDGKLELLVGDKITIGRNHGLTVVNDTIDDMDRVAAFSINSISDELKSDATVSREHAQLEIIDKTTILITDLNSTYGTGVSFNS